MLEAHKEHMTPLSAVVYFMRGIKVGRQRSDREYDLLTKSEKYCYRCLFNVISLGIDTSKAVCLGDVL